MARLGARRSLHHRGDGRRRRKQSGAVAVRVAGIEHLRAVRARVALPIVGLIKREYPGFEPYITPTLEEVARGRRRRRRDRRVRRDAAPPPRQTPSSASSIAAIHAAGRLALADCSTARRRDCRRSNWAPTRRDDALRLHAETAGPTASGAGSGCASSQRPRALTSARAASVRRATCAPHSMPGADAVCVGSAITNVDWLVREFAGATDKGS